MEDEMRVKEGCFAGCRRRVGKFFRQILIKRRRKNKVSSDSSKTSTADTVGADTTDHRSTDGKSPWTTTENIADNIHRSSNGKSPRTTEGTVADNRPTCTSSKGTSPRLTEAECSHVSGEAHNDSTRNDGESGLENFVANYVKDELERISSMFLVNKVDESNKIDEDESTEDAKGNAEDAKGNTEDAKGNTEDAKKNAEDAKGNTEDAKGNTEDAKVNAKDVKEDIVEEKDGQ